MAQDILPDRGGGPPRRADPRRIAGGLFARQLEMNMQPLAAYDLCLYAFDQAGFGNTDNPADYSMEYRVAHARAFIDALKLERFHLIGNSMGAYIAARIALEDPGPSAWFSCRAARWRLRGRPRPSLSARSIPGVEGIHANLGEHARHDAEDAVQERAGHRGARGGSVSG